MKLALLVVSLFAAVLFYYQVHMHEPARVYVQPEVFSSVECEHIVGAATESRADWSRKRHGYYMHMHMHMYMCMYPPEDIAVSDVPALANVTHAVSSRVLPLLRRAFGVPPELAMLVDDLFVVRYRATGGQSGLRVRIDDSTLSFSVALSPPTEYDGGGLSFQLSPAPVRVDQDTAILQPSRLYHRGTAVVRSTLYVLVGFVSVGNNEVLTLRPKPLGSPAHIHGLFARCMRIGAAGEQDVPHPGAMRPSGWDEEEDGQWEPPTLMGAGQVAETCRSAGWLFGMMLWNQVAAVGDGLSTLATGSWSEVGGDAKDLIFLNVGIAFVAMIAFQFMS